MGKTKWDECKLVEMPAVIEKRLRAFAESIGVDKVYVCRPLETPMDLLVIFDKHFKGGGGFAATVGFSGYELEAVEQEGQRRFEEWLWFETIRRFTEHLWSWSIEHCHDTGDTVSGEVEKL